MRWLAAGAVVAAAVAEGAAAAEAVSVEAVVDLVLAVAAVDTAVVAAVLEAAAIEVDTAADMDALHRLGHHPYHHRCHAQVAGMQALVQVTVICQLQARGPAPAVGPAVRDLAVATSLVRDPAVVLGQERAHDPVAVAQRIATYKTFSIFRLADTLVLVGHRRAPAIWAARLPVVHWRAALPLNFCRTIQVRDNFQAVALVLALATLPPHFQPAIGQTSDAQDNRVIDPGTSAALVRRAIDPVTLAVPVDLTTEPPTSEDRANPETDRMLVGPGDRETSAAPDSRAESLLRICRVESLIVGSGRTGETIIGATS